MLLYFLFLTAAASEKSLTGMVTLDALALFAAVVLAVEVPTTRQAGRDAVAALRREGQENAAAYGRARFGPGGESMVVALYSGNAIGYIDPVFAPYFISVLPHGSTPNSSG